MHLTRGGAIASPHCGEAAVPKRVLVAKTHTCVVSLLVEPIHLKIVHSQRRHSYRRIDALGLEHWGAKYWNIL